MNKINYFWLKSVVPDTKFPKNSKHTSRYIYEDIEFLIFMLLIF